MEIKRSGEEARRMLELLKWKESRQKERERREETNGGERRDVCERERESMFHRGGKRGSICPRGVWVGAE